MRYTLRNEFVLSLPVPLEVAPNAAEVAAYEKRRAARVAGQEEEPPVRLRISLMDCLRAYAAEETVDDFLSPAAAGARVTAHKRTRLATFPDHLVLQIRKFTMGEDWTPRKLDVEIELPEENNLTTIDLEWLRGHGLQPGEEELPQEDATASSAPQVAQTPNTELVDALTDMGFGRAACEKAVLLTGNSSLEAATNWVMEHMSDPDFDVPLPLSEQSSIEVMICSYI